MNTQSRGLIALVCGTAIATAAPLLGAGGRPDIEPRLAAGELESAEEVLAEHLRGEPDDDLARFQLGTVQFLRAVERLSQTGVRYGVRTEAGWLPFLRVGAAAGGNREAQLVRYEDLRTMVERFQSDIQTAEATLAEIDDEDLHWDLNFDQVGIDADGDGHIAEAEHLNVIFGTLMNRRQPRNQEEPLVVGFDSADVYWMRGYCHAVMALADAVLAYDHHELFENTAHAFFLNPDTEFAREQSERKPRRRRGMFEFENASDFIAAIHLMDFKLREPARMRDCQRRLLKMVALSRDSWRLIQAEDDDHLEWIPNANQESVIANLSVSPDRIIAWHNFLDEAEAILGGDKLVPFWRRGFKDGVNLHRVLTDPRDFDLVLWVQGSAALPYLEPGKLSSKRSWSELQQVFRGNFIGFALWVN
ncbi:hypothetical protein Pla123a_32770 [Posidoniimonas polymericola]|uniref:EF-hand domain-containing protein n=1 Tax=Posidoniimonas polymericola TaxID=2528002 RepID=A0A5C5YGX9_9BACT|nr:hypothetical protein [Posidoniimonas polymericola]TWT74454.1 hypothetical protein Pla123a_32770 [Posidoniimonas polymericola]